MAIRGKPKLLNGVRRIRRQAETFELALGRGHVWFWCKPAPIHWRDDGGGVRYRTWFLWGERLKHFRSIRRGINQVVDEISAGTFGTQHRKSFLETVVGWIAEQRQMLMAADCVFLWKPKLRIPHTYGNRENQLTFGRLLDTCASCPGKSAVIAAIRTFQERKIRALRPTTANLLDVPHPTVAPPLSRASVNGCNAVAGARVKLGKRDESLAMREGVLAPDARYRRLKTEGPECAIQFGRDCTSSSRHPGRTTASVCRGTCASPPHTSRAETTEFRPAHWFEVSDGRLAAGRAAAGGYHRA